MSRFVKWAAPVVAFALLVSFTSLRAKAADDSKKETGTVSGVVMDSDGKPLAGAEVAFAAVDEGLLVTPGVPLTALATLAYGW